MSLMKKLANIFSSPPSESVYWIRARCNRCGEIIQARVNLNNDLSVDYAEDGTSRYICHKVLMGEGHCFQRLEVDLTFDSGRRVHNRSISGGQFVED